jgi:hypothetical protein
MRFHPRPFRVIFRIDEASARRAKARVYNSFILDERDKSEEAHFSDDCDDLQDRWKPSIQLDKEHAIVVREADAALDLTPQHDLLMPERCIPRLKPALRLEWRRQNGQDET